VSLKTKKKKKVKQKVNMMIDRSGGAAA